MTSSRLAPVQETVIRCGTTESREGPAPSASPLLAPTQVQGLPVVWGPGKTPHPPGSPRTVALCWVRLTGADAVPGDTGADPSSLVLP